MKIAILGYGAEGKSVMRFLKRSPHYKKWAKIVILDKRRNPDYLKDLDTFHMVVKSPGVPFSLPEIRRAIKKGILFTSGTALFFSYAKGITIGITGTKGKSTTCTLLYRMLTACDKDAYLAGNIGKPMLDILPKLKKNSISVLELSSFQLENLFFSPRIAAVLDIFPDHMDQHTSFTEYVRAKQKVATNQKAEDVIFYFKHSKYSKQIGKKSAGEQVAISSKDFSLFSQKDLQIPGTHNFLNAVMAARIALYLKCSPETVRKAAISFKGNPLRLELVRVAGSIRFYNDSASTNPHATAAAMQAFDDPVILIAGGRDKGLSYEVLKEAAKKSKVKQIILCGENNDILRSIFSEAGIASEETSRLEHAVKKAVEAVIKYCKKTETWNIVFSPGAASFDQFSSYKERGKKFNKIVKSLKI